MSELDLLPRTVLRHILIQNLIRQQGWWSIPEIDSGIPGPPALMSEQERYNPPSATVAEYVRSVGVATLTDRELSDPPIPVTADLLPTLPTLWDNPLLPAWW